MLNVNTLKATELKGLRTRLRRSAQVKRSGVSVVVSQLEKLPGQHRHQLLFARLIEPDDGVEGR